MQKFAFENNKVVAVQISNVAPFIKQGWHTFLYFQFYASQNYACLLLDLLTVIQLKVVMTLP